MTDIVLERLPVQSIVTKELHKNRRTYTIHKD